MTDYLTYKGYGRIYVQNKEDIEKVEQIIKDNDPDEFEWYYPSRLVATVYNYWTDGDITNYSVDVIKE